MDYSLHVLTEDEFNKKALYYQCEVNLLFKSNGIPITADLQKLFKVCPTNSIAYLKEGKNIVSLMISSPSSTLCANHTWYITFLITHKNYSGKGYAKKLFLFGIMDAICKGSTTIEILPFHPATRRLIHSIINPFTVGTISFYQMSPAVRVNFHSEFISMAYTRDFVKLEEFSKSYTKTCV